VGQEEERKKGVALLREKKNTVGRTMGGGEGEKGSKASGKGVGYAKWLGGDEGREVEGRKKRKRWQQKGIEGGRKERGREGGESKREAAEEE